MDARIEGDKLHITLEMEEPKPSVSGKTEVVAGTGGRWRTGLKIGGKPIWIVATAFTYPEKPVNRTKEVGKKRGQKPRPSPEDDEEEEDDDDE